MRPVGFSWSRTQRPPGVKPCGNHAAVVEHQQIACLQNCSKTRERIIPQSAGRAIHHQHAARAALCGGCCAINSAGRSKSKSCNAQPAHCGGLPEVAQAPAAARVRWPRSALRASARTGLRRRSRGTSVQRAQLTTIRVNGLGTRNRSHDRIVHACSGSRWKAPMRAPVNCASLIGPILVR